MTESLEEKNYYCHVCKKKFSYAIGLFEHKLTCKEIPVELFTTFDRAWHSWQGKCPFFHYVDQIFDTQKALEQHLWIQHGVKPADMGKYIVQATTQETLPKASKTTSGLVNHPSHYTQGHFESIDVIEDWKLGVHDGAALKYIARWKHKGSPIQDLRKAAWYLTRLADKLEREAAVTQGDKETSERS